MLLRPWWHFCKFFCKFFFGITGLQAGRRSWPLGATMMSKYRVERWEKSNGPCVWREAEHAAAVRHGLM